MSTVDQKRGLFEATKAAEHFRDQFSGTFERWEIAGSIRRRRNEIGDAEHVVIPKFGDVASGDLFATPERKNLVFARMDDLVRQGCMTRHHYANGERWGGEYRGVDYSYLGVIGLNEVFCADADNFGPTLAIRTGPADFSKRLVTGLLRRGMRNANGRVWRCDACPCRDERGDNRGCARCEQTGLIPVMQIVVPTEEAYFELCGIAYQKPEARG